jgi:hypothetical protein
VGIETVINTFVNTLNIAKFKVDYCSKNSQVSFKILEFESIFKKAVIKCLHTKLQRHERGLMSLSVRAR